MSREFLHLRGTDVAGMVLVDANQERCAKEAKFPYEACDAMAAVVDWLTGVRLNEESKLTAGEMKEIKDYEDCEMDRATIAQEAAAFPGSCDALAAKKQLQTTALGTRPLSIIKGDLARDIRNFRAAAVKAKSEGVDIDEKHFKAVDQSLEVIEDSEDNLAREVLNLSKNSRYVVAKHSGHNVQMTEPELIAEEIQWVLSQLK